MEPDGPAHSGGARQPSAARPRRPARRYGPHDTAGHHGILGRTRRQVTYVPTAAGVDGRPSPVTSRIHSTFASGAACVETVDEDRQQPRPPGVEFGVVQP